MEKLKLQFNINWLEIMTLLQSVYNQMRTIPI